MLSCPGHCQSALRTIVCGRFAVMFRQVPHAGPSTLFHITAEAGYQAHVSKPSALIPTSLLNLWCRGDSPQPHKIISCFSSLTSEISMIVFISRYHRQH
jgi:hypothetical protein